MRPPAPLPIYLSGLSTAADALAASSADVYLLPSEPIEALTLRIAAVRALAESDGRTVRFGLRLRPILADSRSRAQAYADRVLRTLPPHAVPPGGSLRQATGALDDAGELIGTPDDVAESLHRYRELGVSTFQLAGYSPAHDVPRFAALISALREPDEPPLGRVVPVPA